MRRVFAVVIGTVALSALLTGCLTSAIPPIDSAAWSATSDRPHCTTLDEASDTLVDALNPPPDNSAYARALDVFAAELHAIAATTDAQFLDDQRVIEDAASASADYSGLVEAGAQTLSTDDAFLTAINTAFEACNVAPILWE